MKKAKRRKTGKQQHGATALFCLRGAMLGCIVTVLFVFLLALAAKRGVVDEQGISLYNSGIKALSAAVAGAMCIGRFGRSGWLLSGISGILYLALAWFVFALIEGTFAFCPKLLLDAATCFVCAAGTFGAVQLIRALRTQQG